MWAIIVAILVVVAVGWMVKRIRARRQLQKRQPLLRPEWKKDVVYLVQFPPSPNVRSISPFCLKVEAWLILNKIGYENVFSKRFGQKGQIPYVELNGEQIPDSNVIIRKLSRHFNVKCDEQLTSCQRAIGHSVISMVENHTIKGVFLYRYVDCIGEILDNYFVHMGITPFRRFFFVRSFPVGIKFNMWGHGIGRHSVQEVTDFVCQDLAAIAAILSDRKYLLDTPTPTSYDCALFGHLAQLLYIQLTPFPHQDFLRKECPNLVAYADRIKNEMWPDWDRNLADDTAKWLKTDCQ